MENHKKIPYNDEGGQEKPSYWKMAKSFAYTVFINLMVTVIVNCFFLLV